MDFPQLIFAVAIQTAFVVFAAGALFQEVRGLAKRLDRIERLVNHTEFWPRAKARVPSDD